MHVQDKVAICKLDEQKTCRALYRWGFCNILIVEISVFRVSPSASYHVIATLCVCVLMTIRSGTM